jgi:hypothetical protein
MRRVLARDAYSEHAATCGACTSLQASAECSVGRRLDASSSELEGLRRAFESAKE